MKTNSYICILKRKRGTPRLKGRKKQLLRKGSEPVSAEQASTQEKRTSISGTSFNARETPLPQSRKTPPFQT